MKKFLCFILFLFFVFPTSAEVKIPEDFYINGGDVLGSDAVIAENILPDTVLVFLQEGEKRKLCVDFLPEDTTERKLTWHVWDGYSLVSIAPEREECIVVGKKAGKAKIKVTAPGGADAEISVMVTPVKELVPLIEEPLIPERPKPQVFHGEMVRRTAKKLIFASCAMFLFAGTLWVKGRKKYGKR